jgi:hypothetical protein
LYTGRGPVCGTIMRGAGGGGAAGGVTDGAGGGANALTDGGAAGEAAGMADGACPTEGGTIGRGGGLTTEGEAIVGAVTGRVGTGGALEAITELGGAVGLGAGGLVTAGATAAGRLTAVGGATAGFSTFTGPGVAGTGGAGSRVGAASLRCVIAFNTSPGREMLERSILVLISSSPREREDALPAGDEPSPEERM